MSAASLARPGAGAPALHGSAVALPTPFLNGAVDEPALARLVRRQVAAGTSALVACGSTGEAPALTPAEHAQVVRVIATAAAGRVPVVAGCGAASTAAAVALAEAAAGLGASALLCAAPPYVKPTQEGMLAHVRAVAHASCLPVILYDVPSRVGVRIEDETVARLFERGLIAAIKDATGDLSRPVRLRRLCGAGLVQLSGDDPTAAAHRAMGGAGCISVTANVAPQICAALHRAWDDGRIGVVATLRDLLGPLNEAMFMESNPIPLKAALAMLGLCQGDLRLPLTRASAATRHRLADILPDIVMREDKSAAPRLSVVG